MLCCVSLCAVLHTLMCDASSRRCGIVVVFRADFCFLPSWVDFSSRLVSSRVARFFFLFITRLNSVLRRLALSSAAGPSKLLLLRASADQMFAALFSLKTTNRLRCIRRCSPWFNASILSLWTDITTPSLPCTPLCASVPPSSQRNTRR